MSAPPAPNLSRAKSAPKIHSTPPRLSAPRTDNPMTRLSAPYQTTQPSQPSAPKIYITPERLSAPYKDTQPQLPSAPLMEVMSREEVSRALRSCMPGGLRGVQGGPKGLMHAIAKAAGLNRRVLYFVTKDANNINNTDYVRTALTPVLRRYLAGETVLEKIGRNYQLTELPPVDPDIWHDKAVRASDYMRGSCVMCWKSKYTLVEMHGERWYLCDQCLPWESAGMGATKVTPDVPRSKPRLAVPQPQVRTAVS